MTGRGDGGARVLAAARRLARRPGRLSLRARLLLISMALLLVGLVASGSVVIGVLRDRLVERVDGQLRPMAAVFARLPPQLISPPSQNASPSQRPSPNPNPNPNPNASPNQNGASAQNAGLDLISGLLVVYLTTGGEVEQTARTAPGSDGPGPVVSGLSAAVVSARGGRPFELPGRDGSPPWRVIAVPRQASGQPPGSVLVAASLSGVQGTLARMRTVCLLTGLGLLALLTVAGWFAMRAGLRPLRRVEQTAAAIAGGDLSRRVPYLAAPGTEIGRLSRALNGMLGQLERAFAARAESEARMRRFVADVSHELRTPLFGIKGFAELYRMGGLPERADVDRAMRRIDGESGRLARLVEDLLLLAQLDESAGAERLAVAPMDLRTLAADALSDLRALDPARPVRLTGPQGGPPGSAPVLGDEARLRQVVANLVGNAVNHTPAGTPVRIGVGTVDGSALLVVEDAGPGLGPEQAARVFERFYRADTSRARGTGGGAGLGLSLAQSLAAAHDGRVELRTVPGQGAAFSLVLPAVPGPAPDTAPEP